MATMPKAAVVLSAGAPNSPLMAGALAAIYDQGRTFDVIYTSGAGAFVGLLFVAPKGKAPDEALRDIVNVGIADAIYKRFPLGYKAYFKTGPFNRPFHRFGQFFKLGEFPLGPMPPLMNEPRTPFPRLYNAWVNAWLNARGGAYKRLYNDWVDLWVSAVTPTDLNYFSSGVSAPFPFLDEFIDFDKLGLFDGYFYMNAYNITKTRMDIFNKSEITEAHVHAALAFPFICPPMEIDGQFYSEGADQDPLNFGNLMSRVDRKEIETLVVLDILGAFERFLVRKPRNVWDAYGISIMTPVVSLAQKNMKYFKEVENKDEQGEDFYKILEMKFDIPLDLGPHITDWSYSNMSILWEIGYATGQKFCKEHGDKLPRRRNTGEIAEGLLDQ